MRVAILGASGMLGSMLVRHISKYFEVVATVRGRYIVNAPNIKQYSLDALEPDAIEYVIHDCDWVINAIGLINKYVNNENLVEAVKINVIFPRLLADVAEKSGCQVIQIATDCVFSGLRSRYTENDIHDATDIYGKTKSLGEINSPNMHHLRCSIIGPELKSHTSLMDWFLKQPKGAVVDGYTNHLWNGITTLHFAKICKGIIESNLALPNVQHVVPADVVSKCELLHYFSKEYSREDVCIKPTLAPQVINRSLATANTELNLQLWNLAGYSNPPTISQMVKELAEYCKN